MSEDVNELRHELQMRLQELESLSLEVRHLQADLQVKDEYIAALQNESPGTQAEVVSARRYLAARSRIRAALQRHPLVWRIARIVVGSMRRSGWIA